MGKVKIPGIGKVSCETLKKWDIEHFWHPYTQMEFYKNNYPPIIVKGEGIYLYDERGRKFMDGTSSIWCVNFGHSQKKILKDIIGVMKKVQHTTTLGLTNPWAIFLAKEISRIIGLPKVFFAEDGSSAVEAGIKILYSYAKRKFKNKRFFASPKGAYHGDTIGSMSVSGKTPFTEEYSEIMFKNIELPSIYCFKCPFNRGKTTEEKICNTECFEETEKIIKKRKDEIIAVFIEGGVQGAGGIIPFPNGYIKFLREITKKYEIFLVVDEIATGFGRVGERFGFMEEISDPDMVILGKGMSGGYLPLSAVVSCETIYEVFKGKIGDMKHFLHGHTYTGNPILSIAGISTLKLFERERIHEKVKKKSLFLKKEISKLYNNPIVKDIRGKGFMWGIEIEKKGKKATVEAAWEIVLRARKKGLLIRPLGNVITFIPPLIAKENEIKTMIDIIEESINEVK